MFNEGKMEGDKENTRVPYEGKTTLEEGETDGKTKVRS